MSSDACGYAINNLRSIPVVSLRGILIRVFCLDTVVGRIRFEIKFGILAEMSPLISASTLM